MKTTQWSLLLSLLFGYVAFAMPWVVIQVQVDQDQQTEKPSYSYLLDDAPVIDGCRLSVSNWKSDTVLNIYFRSLWVGRTMVLFQFVLWLCCLIVYKKSLMGFSPLTFVIINVVLFYVAGTIMTFAAPHLMSCHEKSSAIVQESLLFFPSIGISFASIGFGFFVIKRFLSRS